VVGRFQAFEGLGAETITDGVLDGDDAGRPRLVVEKRHFAKDGALQHRLQTFVVTRFRYPDVDVGTAPGDVVERVAGIALLKDGLAGGIEVAREQAANLPDFSAGQTVQDCRGAV